MSSHNRVLNFAREMLGYYEVAPQYRPYHGNPGYFLGPPVDQFKVEYSSHLTGVNRQVITKSPCNSPTDCNGRFSHDPNSGTASVEALAASTASQPLENTLWLTYAFDFRIDLQILLNPVHSVTFFPYVDIALEWDASAVNSVATARALGYWNVMDSSTGKPAGLKPNDRYGLGPGYHAVTYAEISRSSASQSKVGKHVQHFPPVDPFNKQLYRSTVPLKPRVNYRLIYMVVVSAIAKNGAKCRTRADINFSTVA